VPETIRSKKKVGFIFYHSFYVQQSGAFLHPGSGIRYEKFRDPDPGSEIKHLGFAILLLGERSETKHCNNL
jgi:hypothetical protein